MPALLSSSSCRRFAIGALVVLALGVAAPADAAFPGRNGMLAVVAGDQPTRARPSLVLLRIDGTVVRRIAHAARFGDAWPAWSPDGRLLAFDAALSPAETRLALVRADGTHRRTLPRPAPYVDAIAPAWSPDGRRIAFGATGFDVGGIWTVDRAGRDVCRLSALGQLASWSTRNKLAVGDGGLAVWRMNDDGTQLRRLTRSRSDDPDWSPNGARLVYTRFAHGGEELWTMRADGRDKRRLARGSRPAWSPDGRSIAFVRGRRIFVVNAAGGDPRKVPYTPTTATGRPLRLTMPAWQPLPR